MVDNKLIFCSGTLELAYNIMHEYEHSDLFTIEELAEIAKRLFKKNQHIYHNINLDIMVFYIEDNSTAIYQVSPYLDFVPQKRVVNREETGILSGGIKTQECLNSICANIGKHRTISELFTHVFNDIKCEEIGGNVDIVEVGLSGIKVLKSIDLHEPGISRLTLSTFNSELVIAEMVLGKLILGQRITIGDPHGIWLTEGPQTTITDRYGRVAMQLGLYDTNPDYYGLVVNRYDGYESDSNLINRIIINSEDGLKIQRWNGASFDDKLYADYQGYLFAEDMTAKRFRIVSGTNELMLDSFTKFMDIGRFDNILTDGKLTSLEKLQVLGERTRIISEYQKLYAQAVSYSTTSRDETIRIDVEPFTEAYDDLITYLAPLLKNMDETTEVDRDEFIDTFKRYYDEVTNLINSINDSIKYSSLQLGSHYNNVLIDHLDGITVTRSDEMYRTRLNATDGISIEKNINNRWVKKFYIDVESSRLMAEELIAKKLTITNNMDEIYLDIDDSYLNIGRFLNIITDNKLTAIEKLTLKQEWQTIQTEYGKLLSQAELYKTSDRDDHQSIRIDIPPFVEAYNALAMYVAPLLRNMDETTEIDREEFKNKFQAYYNQALRIINEITDAVKWSSLQLGVNYNKVVIDHLDGITVTRTDELVKTVLNATEGISIYRNDQKVLYADTFGTLRTIDLVAKRLKITGDPIGGTSEDELLIDAESKVFYANRWRMIGLAALDAELLAATFLSTEFGMISDLTAGRLSTLTNASLTGWSNFIEIEGNSAKWLTGRVNGAGTQKALSDGQLLYWVNSSQKGQMTTDVTPWPAYVYPMQNKTKLSILFEGSGESAYPKIGLGEGTGFGEDAGKGYIIKPDGKLIFSYYSGDVLAKERSLTFDNTSLTLLSENGTLQIKHSSGAIFDINTDGTIIKMTHPSSGEIRLSPNGMTADIKGTINFTSTGNMTFNAPQYNFA